jgi:hypothetical protein
MKEHPSAGFVPVNFRAAGKVLLVLGTVFVLMGGVDYVIGLSGLPNLVMFIGVAFLVIGGYIALFAARERRT